MSRELAICQEKNTKYLEEVERLTKENNALHIEKFHLERQYSELQTNFSILLNHRMEDIFKTLEECATK